MPLRLFRYPDRSPNWIIRGTVHGIRVDQSAGTSGRRDAERIAERITAEIRDRHLHGPAPAIPAPLTFAEAAEHYLLEPGRNLRRTKALKPLIRHFGETPITAIDQAGLDAYIRRRHAGQAPATVLRETITPLRAILRHAGLTPKFRQPEIRATRLRFLTPDEATRLAAAAEPHLRPLIIFLTHTGARLGEALALNWSDVDLAARRVTFARTKHGGLPRGVPLNGAALEALANIDYRTGTRDEHGKPIRAKHRTGRVFRTPLAEPYPTEDRAGGGQIKTAWATACRRAGIKGATPHTLRHTFASWLVQRGVPLRTVAELMGHASLSMVMRYAHIAPDHMADAVATLDPARTAGAKTA